MIVVSDSNIHIQRLELGHWNTNCYIVVCPQTHDSVVIDAPDEASKIMDALKGTSVRYILLTHNHRDHVGALAELRSQLKVPLAAHTLDSANISPPPEIPLHHGNSVSFGNIRLEVMHTPGHTPGSLCFRAGRYLIAGDTIFPGGPGHTRSPVEFREIVKSITGKILVLPDDTQIYSGHGAPTVIKKEKDEFAVFAARPRDPTLCGDVLWLSS